MQFDKPQVSFNCYFDLLNKLSSSWTWQAPPATDGELSTSENFNFKSVFTYLLTYLLSAAGSATEMLL